LRGDVRRNTERKNRHAAQHAAAKQIEVAEEATRRVPSKEIGETVGVDAGSRDVSPDPVNRQQCQREEHTLPEIGNPEDVAERFKELLHVLDLHAAPSRVSAFTFPFPQEPAC
jgi:hypothetical protein